MSLSTATLDHLLEAESHLRAALKSASVNETPTTIQMISKVLLQIEQIKKIEEFMDMIEKHTKSGNGGSFGSLFNL